MPGYIEWMLCFPKAPMGSVSVQIWGIACASVVGMLGSAVVAAWALVSDTVGKEAKIEETKETKEKKSR